MKNYILPIIFIIGCGDSQAPTVDYGTQKEVSISEVSPEASLSKDSLVENETYVIDSNTIETTGNVEVSSPEVTADSGYVICSNIRNCNLPGTNIWYCTDNKCFPTFKGALQFDFSIVPLNTRLNTIYTYSNNLQYMELEVELYIGSMDNSGLVANDKTSSYDLKYICTPGVYAIGWFNEFDKLSAKYTDGIYKYDIIKLTNDNYNKFWLNMKFPNNFIICPQ